jgi:hypothetical protein
MQLQLTCDDSTQVLQGISLQAGSKGDMSADGIVDVTMQLQLTCDDSTQVLQGQRVERQQGKEACCLSTDGAVNLTVQLQLTCNDSTQVLQRESCR